MTKKRIYGALFVFCICFIWGNSMLSKEMSGAISQFIANILGGGADVGDEGHHLLRKLAHFSEFAALGALSCLFFGTLTNDIYRKYLSVTLTGLIVPLMDETIQIFSDRGYSLVDVWIDISGFVIGALITVLVLFLIAKFRFVKDVHKEGKKS